jgi:hypothetical protein
MKKLYIAGFVTLSRNEVVNYVEGGKLQGGGKSGKNTASRDKRFRILAIKKGLQKTRGL